MVWHRVPWYLSRWVFWLASLVLLSWPLRVFVQYKIAYVHYYIHKVFGVVDGQRESSVANSCSDIALPSNNTLIPSYSEAMRMDHCGRTESTELLTCHALASTADVELRSETGSAALVPLLQGFQRPRNDHFSEMSLSAVGTGRTMYGTVVYDRIGRAFFRSAACRLRQHRAPVSVQWRSARDGDIAAPVGLRSRRRDAVQKRKRRRSYNEAVGAPSGSETSLALNRVDLPESERARAQRRGRTPSTARASVSGMATSMSTPESFDKLQNASAWVRQLRPVKSFVEGSIQPSTSEADNDAAANHQSSSTELTSTDGDHIATAAAAATVPANVRPELTQSAYDVIGRRFVRCRQDWIDHIFDDDDDDDDLPPSYEDALRMRVVAYDVNAGVQLDDISSVSTTSTYLSSELAVGDTPRRWKAFVRRPCAIVDLPAFHVETSL